MSLYSSTVLSTAGLVSYWRLNETSGTNAADSQDSNPGTYTGGYTQNQTALITGDVTASSVSLNGSTGYVTVPNASNLNITGAFSIEAWVHPTGVSSEQFVAGRWASNQGYGLFIGATSGQVSLYINSTQVLNGVITAGVTSHVVATYDGTNARIYVNNVLAGGPSTHTPPSSNSNPFTIGQESSSIFYAGTVEEVAVYNQALSAGTINTHYVVGSTGVLPAQALGPYVEPRRPGGPVGPQRPGGPIPVTWPAPDLGVAPLPMVLTIGDTIQASSLSPGTPVVPTSVTLSGSINPEGLSGTWWFTYGTTPTMGTLSASAAASASTLPQTITTVLTGLTIGQTYYFAAVGQTAAGTVYGYTLSFVYQAPNTPSTPSSTVSSTAVSSLTIPHMAWPFKIVHGSPHTAQGSQITSNDGVEVVQQDSDGEIYSCVSTILNCQVGQWPENPSFGIYDEAFHLVTSSSNTGAVQLDPLDLVTTVARWEPRANLSTVVAATQGDATGGSWTVVANMSGSST